jgi:hypothetical protein
MNDFDITNDLNVNQPYSTVQRIVDIIFNFLTAVGVIAFAGFAGYMWTRYF